MRHPRPGEAAVPNSKADPIFLAGNGIPQGPAAAEPLEGRPALRTPWGPALSPRRPPGNNRLRGAASASSTARPSAAARAWANLRRE
jgi:hypothetical protein